MSTTRKADPVKERQIAPGIVVRHSRECASTRPGRATCDCAPGYRSCVRTGAHGRQRTISRTFATLAEAAAWVAEAKALQRSGEYPKPREPIPTLEATARDFLIRAHDGKALNRSGRPFAATTIDNYERALRVHVLEFVSNRTRRPLARMLQ